MVGKYDVVAQAVENNDKGEDSPMRRPSTDFAWALLRAKYSECQ